MTIALILLCLLSNWITIGILIATKGNTDDIYVKLLSQDNEDL